MKRYIDNEDWQDTEQRPSEVEVDDQGPISEIAPINPEISERATFRNKAKSILIALGMFIFLSAAGLMGRQIGEFLTGNTSNSGNNVELSATDFYSSTDIKEYTSVEHGFKANFLGFPTSETEFLDLFGTDYPFTIYTSGSEDLIYAIAVYDYTGLGITDYDAALEGSLNGAVQSVDGANLISSSYTSHLGNRAIEGYFTAPVASNGRTDSYIRVIHKEGTDEFYAIFTYGATETEYNNFVNSFNITR